MKKEKNEKRALFQDDGLDAEWLTWLGIKPSLWPHHASKEYSK